MFPLWKIWPCDVTNVSTRNSPGNDSFYDYINTINKPETSPLFCVYLSTKQKWHTEMLHCPCTVAIFTAKGVDSSTVKQGPVLALSHLL